MLESPIHAPKISVLGDLPPKFRRTSFRPPKGTSLRDFTSFELSRVKIHRPVRKSQKKGINKKAQKTLYFTHFPRSPQWMDLYQIWCRASTRRVNQLCAILRQSAQGLRFCRGSNIAISHWLGLSSLTQCWRYRAACDSPTTHNRLYL